MNIALPMRLIKRLKVNLDQRKEKNSDSFWIASVIEDVYPEGDSYLHLLHPGTDMTLMHKMSQNWKENFEQEIRDAFEYNFDYLNSIGARVGSYSDFLESINFTPIPKEHRNLAREFDYSRRSFKKAYQSRTPKEKKNWDTVDWFEDSFQSRAFSDLGYGNVPIERFKKMLKKYPQEEEREEVSFEENREALKCPEFIQILPRDFKGHDKKNVLIIDKSVIYLKNPKDEPKINSLSRKIESIMSRVFPDGPSEEDQKLLNKIRDQINDLIICEFETYTGEFSQLEVPEKLPEEMVLELLISMNLETHLVQRRIAVSADMTFEELDFLLSHLFRWAGFPYHLSAFLFSDAKEPTSFEMKEEITFPEEMIDEIDTMIPSDSSHKEFGNPFFKLKTKDITDVKLRDYFPEHKTAQYRYDFGDNWFHAIELVGIHDKNEYDKPLPYLIDAFGVTPPDDLGGLPGYLALQERDYDYFEPGKYKEFIKNWGHEKENYLKSPSTLAPLFEELD